EWKNVQGVIIRSGPNLTDMTNGLFTVVAHDAHNCLDSATALIQYDDCCKPFIPDAFTPNGDGKNDLFRLRYKGDISKLEFSVYNRFGERIFVTTNVDDGWDGTYHGVKMDMGTYFYYTTFLCGN